MALPKPTTVQPSSPKQKPAFPMAPAPAPAPQPTPASNPSFRSVEPKLPQAQPHPSITPGTGPLPRSDPPTPSHGSPPTPKRRPHNELSKADPPTSPRGPPLSPRHREDSLGAPDSLSRGDSPTPPGGSPTSARRALGRMMRDSNIFNSLSVTNPPRPATPPAPPPSPAAASRALPMGLSTPPSAPPPSPQRCRARTYTDRSLSQPPSAPGGPPPAHSVPWTTQEINLLVSVCGSGVELGWCQIAGLFHGRSVLECRNQFQDVTHGQREAIDLEHGCCAYDCGCGWSGEVFYDNSRSISRKCLSIPTEPEDLVPELIVSNEPSPVGSPVADRRVTTKRSWGQIGDVETAGEGTIHYNSYGDNSSNGHYSSKKAKTIAHLSDELNFVLSQQWASNVMDRIQEQHAMSQHVREKYWSPSTAPGFELVQVSSVLGNQS